MVVLNQNQTIYANFSRRPSLTAQGRVEGLRPEGFVFTLFGEAGTRYQIERSSNLGSWTPSGILTNWYGTNQFRDPAAYPLQFYRAVALP
jgi:hypothetical protein